jgi:hypothetical protein
MYVKGGEKMKAKDIIIIVISALSLIILCISLKYTYDTYRWHYEDIDDTGDSKSAMDGVFSHWEGRDIVYINRDIYEYNLYTATNENLDDAIAELLDNFWKNEASLFGAVPSENRTRSIENNTELSDGVKRMMGTKNVNISTTKYFYMEGERCMLTFTINYTRDFKTYSFLNEWDEVSPWWDNTAWENKAKYYQVNGLEYLNNGDYNMAIVNTQKYLRAWG